MTAPTVKLKKRTKKPQRRGVGRSKPTPKQAKAIALITQNLLSKGNKSLEDILLEAGYDADSARQQTNVMAGIKAHVDPIVARMERLRDAAMGRMEKSIRGASYADVTRAMHTLTHNIRLLSGKSTQNHAHLVKERRDQLDDLVEA
jgi:hypothetical protein